MDLVAHSQHTRFLSDTRHTVKWTPAEIAYVRDVVFKDAWGITTYVDLETRHLFYREWADFDNFDVNWSGGNGVYRILVRRVNAKTVMDAVAGLIRKTGCCVSVTWPVESFKKYGYECFQRHASHDIETFDNFDFLDVYSKAQNRIHEWTDDDIQELKTLVSNPFVSNVIFKLRHTDEFVPKYGATDVLCTQQADGTFEVAVFKTQC